MKHCLTNSALEYKYKKERSATLKLHQNAFQAAALPQTRTLPRLPSRLGRGHHIPHPTQFNGYFLSITATGMEFSYMYSLTKLFQLAAHPQCILIITNVVSSNDMLSIGWDGRRKTDCHGDVCRWRDQKNSTESYDTIVRFTRIPRHESLTTNH